MIILILEFANMNNLCGQQGALDLHMQLHLIRRLDETLTIAEVTWQRRWWLRLWGVWCFPSFGVCVLFFGVDRRRLFPACGLQNVPRDLHRPTAAEPSYGAFVSAPAVVPEAHGLFTPGQHLLGDIDRFSSVATPVETECGCCRTAVATTSPGPELRSICSWRLPRRPRPDGEALVFLPQDKKTH